jgi:hypothetical protein
MHMCYAIERDLDLMHRNLADFRRRLQIRERAVRRAQAPPSGAGDAAHAPGVVPSIVGFFARAHRSQPLGDAVRLHIGRPRKSAAPRAADPWAFAV